MYARTSFEQWRRASVPPHPSSPKPLSSPLLSHRCAHLRPHPLSFDIHPQNTPGWGTPIPTKNFIFTPIDPLTPILPTHTGDLSVTPIIPTLTQNRGYPPFFYRSFHFGILRTAATEKKRPRGLRERRSLLQTVRGKSSADQLLMSVLASSFASRGSRNTLLASGATAMEAFISLEAVAKSPVCDARRACARWLSQWLGSRFATCG